MKSKSRMITRLAAFLVLACVCCAELPMLSCFGARFKPGDEIGLPPLPPSDTIMGFFSKFKSMDNQGNIYQLKDLPFGDPNQSVRTYPEKPTAITFNGQFSLYFILRTEDDANGITSSVEVANMQPASPYIDTGPNGIAESGLGGDDVQVKPVDTMGLAETDIVVSAGPNGILETLLARDSDDYICDDAGTASSTGTNICAGYNGKAESGGLPGANVTHDIQGVETPVTAVSTFLGISKSVKYYSHNGILTGQGEPNRLAVTPGANGLVQTPCIYDDNLVRADTDVSQGQAEGILSKLNNGVYNGLDGITQSGVGANDIQVYYAGETVQPYSVLILPGPGDKKPKAIPKGGTDIQLYPSGASVGADVPVVAAGPSGVLETCPGGDNYVIMAENESNQCQYMYQGQWYWGNKCIYAGPKGKVFTTVSGDDTYGAIKTVSGTVASGLGGDDVQFIPGGTSGLNSTDLIISAGTDGIINTMPNLNLPTGVPGIGDDYKCDADGTQNDASGAFICAGLNGIAESGLWGDDIQLKPYGSSVGPNEPMILAGPNKKIDTPLASGDDTWAIVDGGNGLAESGLGGDDVQAIPVGQGLPGAVEITAAPHANGTPRKLITHPAGDDKLIYPGSIYPELSGDGIFTKDNPYTVPDPDGDGFIENYATVDDGEYYSWKDTNITNDFLPPLWGNPTTGDVVDDVQMNCAGGVAVDAGGNGVLETAPQGSDYIDSTGTQILCGGGMPTLVDYRGILSFNAMINPNNPAQLLGYLSNGRNIYLTQSTDGLTWDYTDPDKPVLSPGGTGRPGDPVVLAGVDGICETEPEGNDGQGIAPGQGQPNTIAIFAGPNHVIDSIPQGDDYIDGLVIRTGPNGIRETPLAGDDVEIIPLGQGQPDGPCILADPYGLRNTSNAAIGKWKCSDHPNPAILWRNCSSDIGIVGDDRPPFLERKTPPTFWRRMTPPNSTTEDVDYQVITRNSAYFDPNCDPSDTTLKYGNTCPWLPEMNEPAVSVGSSAGFDSMGVSDPVVMLLDGTYYMYYTGIGALIEPEPARPKPADLQLLGPCLRSGLNQSMDTNYPPYTPLTDINNADNNSSVVVAQRIGVATSSDGVNWQKVSDPVIPLSNLCGSSSDISILTNIIGPGLPLPSYLPGSTAFDYNATMSPLAFGGRNYDGSPIFVMLYTGVSNSFDAFSFLALSHPNNDHPLFTGTGTGVGLARSFDGINWTKMTSQSPVFTPGLLGSTEIEASPALQTLPDSYLMYYQATNVLGEGYIATALRSGAVYPSCLSVARTPFSSVNTGATICFIALLILPAMVLVTRRILRRKRN